MGNIITQVDTYWYNIDNFKYKRMLYEKSCVPCSMHIVYANLGRISASGSEIEEECNTWSENLLISTGLTQEKIEDYMKETSFRQLGNCTIFTQQNLISKTDIVSTIENEFLNAPSSSAMITGTFHAEVFFKTCDKKIYFCSPSPLAKDAELNCYEIDNVSIEETTDHNKKNVVIHFKVKKAKRQCEVGHDCTVMAEFFMLIK